MRLQELMLEIQEWESKTFIGQSIVGKAEHLKKEVSELIDELNNDVSSDETKQELADCFILLVNIASKVGMSAYDLLNEVELKLAINKTRNWGKLNEKGFSEHLK